VDRFALGHQRLQSLLGRIEALKRSLIRDEIDESVVVLCRTLRLPSTAKVFDAQDDSTRPFNGPALQRFIISTRRAR